MQYILYARKSTDDEDRQLLSIEAQITELREFALKEGLCIHKKLIEAKTAKYPGRPLFNSMLQALEAQEADGILAWHPDRLARNSVDGGKIIYLLDKGIIKDLKFPTYRLDNNAQGKFMLSIIFGQSKYYIDALSENIKRGIRQKLRNGIWPQRAPLGYLNDRKTRTIVTDKDKAPYIRKAFELYSTSEYSLSRLRDSINECGLTGTKDGILSISNYHFMLKNPIYYGLIRFNGEVYEGTHEPIITKKLFDKAQRILEQRSKPHKKKAKYFVFRGLVRCGECGAMITAEIQKGHIYYRCTKRVKQCSQTYIRQEQLAEQIKAAIQKVSISDDWADNILGELKKDKTQLTQSSKSHLQNLEAQIKQIDNKISRLIDIYLEGHLALQEYQAKNAQLIEQKKNIQETIRDFSEAGNNWFEQAHSFITSLRQARYISADGNLESQKEFLQKIGSNFKIKERRLSFSTNSPFSLVAEGARSTKWRRVKDVKPSCRTFR
ncbi:MAG: recombinase family protein [Candidatus Pacebacteria bacterium]|nr:recombinase family protein [Candidatus Paceibacterota bacterium]